MIKIKRVYDAPTKEDGFRILVDRSWPRGVSKEKAKVDLWLKEIAPSNELRTLFCHDPKKWDTFKKKYEEELKDKGELIRQIKQMESQKGTVTLVYSAKDTVHNNAVALSAFLKKA